MVRFDPANLAKTIRAKLIEQSGISGEFVRNAASLYGTALNKAGFDDIFSTIQHSDVLLIFEIVGRDTENNVSFTEEATDDIVLTRSYEVRITAYGDQAHETMEALVARLRTSKVGDDLYALGIYLQYVDTPSLFHEIINGSVWTRSDASAGVSIETAITPVVQGDRYTEVGDLVIIERR